MIPEQNEVIPKRKELSKTKILTLGFIIDYTRKYFPELLYWNGYDKTKKLTYIDDSTTESTNHHKWLVKLDDENAVWKRTDELKITDKIIKIIE